MNDNDFWLTVWKLVAGIVCIATVSISGCVGYESTLVTEMVAKGASPMAARCAISASNINAALCVERK